MDLRFEKKLFVCTVGIGTAIVLFYLSTWPQIWSDTNVLIKKPVCFSSAKWKNGGDDKQIIRKRMRTLEDATSRNVTSCQPHKRIVFLKTHKTGSTTTATIIERFGYCNSLSFVLPSRKHVFSQEERFSQNMIDKSVPNFEGKRDYYDIIVNHVRFDHSAMKNIIPGAKFITIIRNPSSQLESAFGYYEEYKLLNISDQSGSNPFGIFMQRPTNYIKTLRGSHGQLKNGQLYDLGLDHKYMDNQTLIEKKIRDLGQQFDLVMINEYFDHSLILLKETLCWEMEDIVYFSKGVRSDSHRFNLTSNELKAQILKWNRADLLLYQYFNETLWRKIEEYGYREFNNELALLRRRKKEAEDACIEPDIFNFENSRVVELTLLQNAPAWCADLFRGDTEYVPLLRNKQMKNKLWAFLLSML